MSKKPMGHLILSKNSTKYMIYLLQKTIVKAMFQLPSHVRKFYRYWDFNPTAPLHIRNLGFRNEEH